MSVRSEIYSVEATGIPTDMFCCSLCESEYCDEEKLRCVTCEYVDLCETCVKSHLKKLHEVIDNLGRNPASCNEHYLLLSLYCEDCNVSFCQACSEKHSSHVFVNVHSKASQFRREVFELIDRSELLTKPMKKSSDEVAELKSNFTSREDRQGLQVEVVSEMLEPSIAEVVTKLKKFVDKKEASFADTLDELNTQSDENDNLTCTLKNWLASNDTQLVQRFIDEIDSVNSKLSQFQNETENLRCIVSSKKSSNQRTEARKKLLEALEEYILPTDNHRMVSIAKKECRVTLAKENIGPFEQYIKTPDFVLALTKDNRNVEILINDEINELAVHNSRQLIVYPNLKYRSMCLNQNFLVLFESSENSNAKLHFKDLKVIGIKHFEDGITLGSNKYLFAKPLPVLKDRSVDSERRKADPQKSETSKSFAPKTSLWPRKENNSISSHLRTPSGLFGSSSNKRVFGQSSSGRENPTASVQSPSSSFEFPKVMKFSFNSPASMNVQESQNKDVRPDSMFNFSPPNRSILTPTLQTGARYVDFACEEINLARFGGNLDNILAVRFLPPKTILDVKVIEYVYWDNEKKAVLSSENSNFVISCEKRPCSVYVCDDVAVTVESNPESIDCSIYALSDTELKQFETNKISVPKAPSVKVANDEKFQIVEYRNINNDRFLLLGNMSAGTIIVLLRQKYEIELVDCGFRWSVVDMIDVGGDVLLPLKLLLVKGMVYNENSKDLQFKIICVTNDNSVIRRESQ